MNKALIVAAFFFLFNGLANASQMKRPMTSYQSFYGVIEQHRINCAGVAGEESTCSGSWKHQDLFDTSKELKKISTSLVEKLQKIAFDQAQIWGDTILEGDYVASGETILDQVFAIYQDGNLKAYYIKYHEKAWYVGDCDYDYETQDPNSLAQCTEGRIREGTYVSPDLKTVITDDENYADFE